MIKSKQDLKFYLFADYYMRYGDKTYGILKRIFARDYILEYLKSMRWTAYYNNCVGKARFISPMFLFHYWRFHKLGVKLGFSIGYNSLGYGAVIPHYGTIVVNGESYLGKYCVLHTCTCVAGSGKIGDGLYLSTGSIIVNPNLGDYVTIGANSLVHNYNIGVSYALLIGSPAEVLKSNYTRWYDRDGWSEKCIHIENCRKQFYN